MKCPVPVYSLLLNQAKTKSVAFSIRYMGELTKQADNIKFLGVYLNPKHQWDTHIDNLCTKIIKNLLVLWNLRYCVITDVLKAAYFELFHLHLAYIIILVWGHSTWTHQVFVLQRKAVRVLAELGFREDCRQAFRSLGIMTFLSQYLKFEYLKTIGICTIISAYNGLRRCQSDY